MKYSNILLVDTTNNYLIFSLFNSDLEKIIFFKKELNRNLTLNFNFYLSNFLHENKIKTTDIDAIYVVRGPGSFTGLKIGCIFANTFKITNKNLNLYQIDSIQFLKCSDNEKTAIDARGNKFYIKNKYRYVHKKINLDLYKTDYSSINQNNIIYNIDNFKKVKFIKPLYIKKPF